MPINKERFIIRKEKRAEAKRRYRSTEKYRETERSYRNLPATKEKVRAAQKRYRHTEAYRAKARAYNKLPHVRARDLAYQRKRHSTPRGRWLNLLSQAKKRAVESRIPFDELLRERILHSLPTHCACCEKELDYSNGKGLHPNGPSLDRIIPELGYTPQNVCATCWRCNDVKGDATICELETVIAYMRRCGLH